MCDQFDKDQLFLKPTSLVPVPGLETYEAKERIPDKQKTPFPPPNGGAVAWLQVAGAFFLFFNSWGVVNTFGVFQSYYEETLLPSHSPSSISWIGTVQGFLLLLVGVIVGPMFDKGYIKSLIAIGLFLVVFGLMMTSLSTKYYQIFLAHGVVVGTGCAFLFLPSMAIVATYFTSRRAIATGVTASGGSIGAVVYPIMFHKLIEPVGFGWTTRIIAFVVLAGLCFSLAVMKVRLSSSRETRSQVDLKAAFLETPYLLFNCGIFFSFVGLYFSFFYLPTYFTSFLHSDADIGFYSIAILNAASLFGRIAPGFVADHIGCLNTMVPISFIASILAFGWIGIRSQAGAIAFACLYGFSSGAIVSLPPTIVARLTPNMSIMGTRMGISFTFAGVGLLIGNPIAGNLLDLEHAVFWKAQLFSAVMLIAGTILFMWVRILKWRKEEGWKI